MHRPENFMIAGIVGPTGVGKTAAAIEIARQEGFELLSVDSRQIYIGMDIATGKEVDQGEWRTLENRLVLEIDGVPIHGLNLIPPDKSFSVSDWYQYAVGLIDEIYSKGRKLLLVGGTGFYFGALQGKIDTLNIPPNAKLRSKLEQMNTTELVGELEQADASKVMSVDVNNRRRLIRAIEIATHGSSAAWPQKSGYALDLYGLTMNRQQLYEKIDQRIDGMISQGLVEETRRLLAKYSRKAPAMSGIGYAEIAEHLEGNIELDVAIQRIKWRNHSYVRRQYTWFKKQPIHWVDIEEDDDWRSSLVASIAA